MVVHLIRDTTWERIHCYTGEGGGREGEKGKKNIRSNF